MMGRAPFSPRDLRQVLESLLDQLLGILVVLKLSGQVSIVRRQVEMAVPRQAKEDGARLARLLGLEGLLDGGLHGVRRFGRRQDPLILGKEDRALENRPLGQSLGFDQPFVIQLADERRIPVVTQASRVNARRYKGMPQ